jgi:hypothetical protein
MPASASRPHGAGDRRRPPRFASAVGLGALLLLAAGAMWPSAAPAALAPRLRALLKAGRTVVAGTVADSTSYDDDRVAVVAFDASTVFKGRVQAPTTLSLIELHEGSSTEPLAPGTQGLAFLRPAAMTSYLQRTIPHGRYDELLPEYGAFVAAGDAADAARQVSIIQRLLRVAGGATLSAQDARQLTFDLLAGRSPVLVEDGAAGLADLPRGATLTDAESSTLAAALRRTDLPERVRIALISAVAEAQLGAMVPTLRAIDSPPAVMEAALKALDALGAGESDDDVRHRLASTDPSIRLAAARQLLRRSGTGALTAVAPVAVKDPDPKVRLEVVEAIGALQDAAALPTLEQAFLDPEVPQRQAAARAIIAVGGKPAADALTRLATQGSLDAQRYAVVVLMTLNTPDAKASLAQLAKTHPDAETRDLITHGVAKPEH